MTLPSAAIATFVASSYFTIFGTPFSSEPWTRFEGELQSELQGLAKKKLIQHEHVILTDGVRNQAQDAAALAGLPQRAALTAIGFWIAVAGWWGPLLALAMFTAALSMQARVDMHRQVFGQPVATVAIMALNVIGLVIALAVALL
jgi:hypothetical protein